MSSPRCVLIGASPAADPGWIRSQLLPDDCIVCADGGWVIAQKAGAAPRWIVGDFDSSPPPPAGFCERIIYLPTRKDDTDTLFAARLCLQEGFRDFLLLGMTGGRWDHSFANLSVLAFFAENGARAAAAEQGLRVQALSSGQQEEWKGCPGDGFGIFPFGCEEAFVTLRGFAYNGEALRLSSLLPIGVSNTVEKENALVRVDKGRAVFFLYASQI